MQDRVSLYPGRVKLEPVAGQANLYDLTRADQPTQEGTPLNKASFLKDYTCGLLGLSSAAVPDDALLALLIGVGYYGYRVKVQYTDGTPAEGVTVSGISALPGSSLVTGADGIVVGRSSSASATIGCTSPYIDQKAPASQSVASTGTITDVTLTLENVTDMLMIASSKTVKISPLAKTVDVTAVGGGGGGGGGISNSYGGGGGGGGYITTELAVDLSKTTQISILVGAGGEGAITDSDPRPSDWHEASDGGNTTVQLSPKNITASGGKKGESKLIGDSAPYVAAKGGAGNGSGGGGSLNLNENQAFASRGKNASGYIFNDPSLGIAGGGGGGGGGYINSSHSSVGANGGTPNGGTGTCQSTTNTNSKGKSFGGGGGGTDCKLDSAHGYGGAGGTGGVYLRFHFDAA